MSSSLPSNTRTGKCVLTWTSDSYFQRLQPTYNHIRSFDLSPVSTLFSLCWLSLCRIPWDRPLTAGSCATLTWYLKVRLEAEKLKRVQSRWAAEDSSPVPLQGSLMNLGSVVWPRGKGLRWAPRWLEEEESKFSHTTRSDQSAVVLVEHKVFCNKRLKHPMMLGCTTDDVSRQDKSSVNIYTLARRVLRLQVKS